VDVVRWVVVVRSWLCWEVLRAHSCCWLWVGVCGAVVILVVARVSLSHGGLANLGEAVSRVAVCRFRVVASVLRGGGCGEAPTSLRS